MRQKSGKFWGFVVYMYLYRNKYANKYKKVWMETKYVVCLQHQCHKNDI